jgi:hypothetical protein
MKTVRKLARYAPIAVAIFNPAAALGLSGIGATAVNFGIATGLSSLAGGDDDSRGSGAGKTSGSLLINNQSSVEAINVIYGDRRIAGARVYMNSTNASGDLSGDEYLHLAFAICQGGVSGSTDNIQGITQILFNNNVVWTSAGGLQGAYASNVDIRLWYGSPDQTRDTPDVSALGINIPFSTEWTTAHRGRGVAMAYITIKYNRDLFPGLPVILFDVQGKKIRGKGSPGTYTSDADTCKNPALIVKDYLLSTTYGKGLSADQLDMASFDDAADYCTQTGLQLNGAIITSNTLFNNVKSILAAGNLNLLYSKGQYVLRPVNKITNWSGVYDFNTSNILGSWQISLGNKRSKKNTIILNYFNPEIDWQQDSIRIQPSAYLSADNNVLNEQTIELPYTSDALLAERLARFYLDQTRYATIVNFTANWSALQLDVGDPVTVTHNLPGWTAKRFRVNSIVLNQDGTVDVELVEYAPHETITYLEDSA